MVHMLACLHKAAQNQAISLKINEREREREQSEQESELFFFLSKVFIPSSLSANSKHTSESC